MTVLLITGSRHGRPDVAYWLDRWVDKHGRPSMVVLGDARGVDSQAREWCEKRGLRFSIIYAEWERLGKRAGPVRNQEMVDAAQPGDWLLAFPWGDSRGTRDCMRRGVERGLRVYEMPLRSP